MIGVNSNPHINGLFEPGRYRRDNTVIRESRAKMISGYCVKALAPERLRCMGFLLVVCMDTGGIESGGQYQTGLATVSGLAFELV